MSKDFKIKDPIFGYIFIDDENVRSVLNSAVFHRLQDIIQTSYLSVYPSAVHNRFVHSLGVYYLGKFAAKKLESDIINQNLCKKEKLKLISKTFILACMMHDIGHSPFSHTGEKFFFQYDNAKPETPIIWQQLLSELHDESFEQDSKNRPHGKEHEIMSALVALQSFRSIFNEGTIDKSFFTRCIIGLHYSDKSDIKNCFIDLLNSETIDVDKLDYLIRDSFITGFKSIDIDYERLLNSVCVIKSEDIVSLGFEKSALSTLESVILAHDMERKWIQNHPVIKYESYLVSYMIRKTIDSFKHKEKIDIFTPEALTENGIHFKNNKECICLVSDSDIKSYAKKLYDTDTFIKEYFNRSLRHKPLWKSEIEYRMYLEQIGIAREPLNHLEERVQKIENILIDQYGFPILNKNTLSYFKSKIKNNSLPKELKDNSDIQKTINFLSIIEEYCSVSNLDFDFVFISSYQFSSGFNKEFFKNIKIRFSGNEIKHLEEILYLFKTNDSREKFFYIFTTRENFANLNVKNFTYTLAKYALEKINKNLE